MATVDSVYERELLHGLVTGLLFCGPCFHASRRTALRKKYNLKGSRGMDCILSCFCGACLICQEAIAVNKLTGLSVPFAFIPTNPHAAAVHAAAAPYMVKPTHDNTPPQGGIITNATPASGANPAPMPPPGAMQMHH